MPVEYVSGDLVKKPKQGEHEQIIIAHICNDIGGWGAGFTGALSSRWLHPEMFYRRWRRGAESRDIPFELGQTQFVNISATITVANMIAQHGVGRGKRRVRYRALAECLDKVCEYAKNLGASVHMPRIGCGLAGGSWDEIEPIINKSLVDKGVRAIVYDL